MELDFNVEEMVDLSFLTDEELEVIVHVLYRDTELRLLEDQRIKKLRQSVLDPKQLKIATGDWFKEVRAKRHTDKKFGSDIIRASIRKKKRTKGERQKKVTINNKEVIINEQEDQEQEQQDNVDCTITNRVSPEEANTEMVEADCQQSEIHKRLVDNKCSVNSKEETLPANTQTQRNGNMTPQTKDCAPCAMDNEMLRAEERSKPVPTITVQLQNDDEIDGDACSQHSDESRVPTKDVDANSSLSSFQSPTLSGSMMSLYSNADFGCIDVRGSITFSLYYDENSLEFNINVVQCDDLAGAKKNRSDPYVKSYLLPDKSSRSKRKTSVKKKTLNPTFNEWLKYKLEKDELQSRTLNLSVWHSDHFGRNLFLGEVEISLETWDWSNTKPTSYILHPRIAAPSNMIQNNSQLYLSVKFIPAGTQGQGLPPTTELHIHLKEARNLVPIRSKGINTFVKCYILPDVMKASRQKTRVIKKDLNPVYNHTMVYDGFQTEDMNETCAEITVWDHDTFSSQLLGGLRLSLGTGLSYGQPVNWMDSNEEEISTWRRMLSEPGQWVDSILPLRPNMKSME
ncbi:synaptotagmin-like protein 2 isoform X1 [Scyliorhinus canicula]|uniref:synaptotagmin-like protein 2 isoform X1 n=1 Tax=Scyliorhinus canicula TaxID=7830 RepID=UPI0018F42D72|nr:synaptotagmin-like protein 2 isoform X1 [Scyliorhinus canicula]XP_038653488.1 synaptotagmin-like protein 2 isoform X1 [Scyliorhinus canicula]XP_038653493.1 synaptotagmin-like protein 2 isoform X1 [Scyliorhinus canicula]